MAPKKSPAPAPIEDKNTVAIPRPRLHKLTVKNFRAIGSEPVTLELDDIVVLVGSNNSGKSSILRAYEVVMLHGSKEGDLTLQDFPNAEVTKESPIDFAAGIVMKKKVGDIVNVGDVLATLYTSKEVSIGGAERLYKEALTINDAKPVNEPLIFARVEKDSVEKF